MQQTLEVPAFVLKDLGITTPRVSVGGEHWLHIRDLELVDPSFRTPGKVDILLGADIYAKIVQEGVRRGISGEPTAQYTALGWIVFEGVEASSQSNPEALTTHLQNKDHFKGC